MSAVSSTMCRVAYPVIDPLVRFWKRVDASDPGGCWFWTGGRQARGRYGAFTLPGGKQTAAHRFAYEAQYGPIPAGHQIDHLCRETLCVRPDHLEAVSAGENSLRSNRSLHELSKTHCPQGHPYDEANTIRNSKGWRRCRECCRRRSSAYYAAHPEKWVEWRERRKTAQD